MEAERRRHFRDEFRTARAAALRNSEAFDEILFAVERLGRYLLGRQGNLWEYQKVVTSLAAASPLATALPAQFPQLHAELTALYTHVRHARNSALHEGAFARHLTARTIELATIIEDALSDSMATVGDFMVRGPTCASLWFPLSFVRQLLLANSFSFLPVRIAEAGEDRWSLVSDYRLASYVRAAHGGAERERRLSESLQDAVSSSGALMLEEPFLCLATTPAVEALSLSRGLPVLVIEPGHGDLLGIATPFDFL